MKWLKNPPRKKYYQREQISNLFGYIRVALYKSTFKSRSRLQSPTILCSLLHRALHAGSAVFSHQHIELEQHTHSGGPWRYVAAPELDQISRLFSAAAATATVFFESITAPGGRSFSAMVIQFFVCAVGPEIYTAEGENVQRILFLSWLFNIIQDRDD